ncbi:hypothetical protein JCM16303_006315 [Sporobolomyces ruberrimus]
MKLVAPHPHLVELFDVFESESNLYLVTEYCPVGELFQYITQNALTRVERCRFYSQLISALLHLSRLSISHRDIKFENLLLYYGDHGLLSIKVADMGMATLQLEDTFLRTSCGSPHYAAPEVIEGIAYDGSLADVWSAGVCLYAMVTRTLPFDDPQIPTLLSKIKAGQYEIESFIGDALEKDVIVRSLRRNVKERITLEQLAKHPYISESIELIDERFQAHLEAIVKDEREKQTRKLADLKDFENLELPVLASLGIVLKVSTLDEVNKMLKADRNHARLFYSKLLEFRISDRTPTTVSLQSMYEDEIRHYEDFDDDSMDLSHSPFDPSLFPDPPKPPSSDFLPLALGNPRLLAESPRGWGHAIVPPRASLPDSELLHSLSLPEDGADEGKILHSAPPQTQRFPSHLTCLHEFGPLASAPPQIESFLTEPLPLSPRIKRDISRRNSVVAVDPDLPFLELADSPVSPKTSLLLENSSDRLLGPIFDALGGVPARETSKKPTMQQRIRSLLSAPPPRLPEPVTPRVSIAEAARYFRPPSPSASISSVSSRLTRSNAYRSLGRALLGKGPKSPTFDSTYDLDEQLSYAHAERVVFETLIPSFSPIPSLVPDIRHKGKEKAENSDQHVENGATQRGSGDRRPMTPSSLLISEPKESSETIRKSMIKKKLSMGMLQFFHDDTKSSSPASLAQASSPPTKVIATPRSSTSPGLTKEKRRPKALSIASSNLLALDSARITQARSPALSKRLSFLGLGPSRSSHLLPPSPLVLDPISASVPSSPRHFHRLTVSDDLSKTQSIPLESPRAFSTSQTRSPTLTFPLVRPAPPTIRRRSTFSTILSPLAVPEADTSCSTASVSSGESNKIQNLRLEKEKLVFENRVLQATLASREEEIRLMKRREREWLVVVEEAIRARGGDGTIRKESSKSRFEDEDHGEERINGTEAQWVDSLKRLSRGFEL